MINNLQPSCLTKRIEDNLQREIDKIRIVKECGFLSSTSEEIKKKNYDLLNNYRKYRNIAKTLGMDYKKYDKKMCEETFELKHVPISNVGYKHFLN